MVYQPEEVACFRESLLCRSAISVCIQQEWWGMRLKTCPSISLQRVRTIESKEQEEGKQQTVRQEKAQKKCAKLLSGTPLAFNI